jgi:prefoldin subunit 5
LSPRQDELYIYESKISALKYQLAIIDEEISELANIIRDLKNIL